MAHAILIGRQTLRFPGCRAHFIKKVSSVKADIAIRNRFGESHSVHNSMASFYRMYNELRNRVEYSR
jgi:hypothetical protein